MGIPITGFNSTLPPNIVEQIMDAERAPIKNMRTQAGKSESRLKLVTDLEAKIGAIQKSIGELANTRGFADMKVTSGDPNIIQGVLDPENVTPGNWNIEVVKLASKAAAVTNGFPDKDKTEIGVGYFSFNTPEGKKEVAIKGGSNTLEGAAKAINSAKVGVRATVMNDRKDPEAPYKLVISAESVGYDNQVEYPTLYFLDGDQDIFFDDTRPAENGVVKVDGFEFEIPDNVLKDIIPGVTLELKQAAPGRSVNISVKENVEAVSGKIQEFIKATNDVLGFIQQQNALSKGSDTSSTLGGDSLLRSIESRLRNLVQGQMVGIRGPIKQLNQLGIQFNRNGTLEFDQQKFNTMLARNPESVQQFFSGDGFSVGFIPSLKNTIATIMNKSFGPLTIRKQALQDKISKVNEKIENKEKQLVKKEEGLRRKFADLDQKMSKMQAQMGQVQAMGAKMG